MSEEKLKTKEEKERLKVEFRKTMDKLEKTQDVERMIKDNRIHFKVKDVDYKVRKPNYSEQMEIEKFRRKKNLEFMADDTMLFRKQWVEIYKKKGIDIDKMGDTMRSLQNKINSIMLRLAKTQNDKDVEKLKTEIVQLKDEQASINIEKTDLLSSSIEDVLNINVTSYYAYIVLERKEGDNWVKAFKDYNEFTNSRDTELLNKCLYNVNYLIYQPLF